MSRLLTADRRALCRTCFRNVTFFVSGFTSGGKMRIMAEKTITEERKQRMKHRILPLVLLLALMLSLLSGCGEQTASSLRVAIGPAEEMLDPAYTTAGSNSTVLLHLYDNLMRLETDGNGATKLVSGAAVSYDMSDNYDGTVSYRFTISPEATWTDGKAVTAEDFVFAWQRLISAETASPHASLLSMVSGYEEALAENDPSLLAVTAEESGKLLVTLSWHCPYFLRSICTSAATVPLREDILAKYGEHWASESAAIVSNGAYALESWDINEGIVITRRENMTEKGPATISFVPAADADEADGLFSGGAVDFAAPLNETAYLRAAAAADFAPTPLASAATLYFGSGGKCADETLRRALFLATDYSSLAELYASSPSTPAAGFVPGGILTAEGKSFREESGSKTDVTNENYRFRLKTAEELLASMDQAPGTVRLLYPAQSAEFHRLAECVAATWRSMLGLSVELLPLESGALTELLTQGSFDCALIRTDSDVADAMSFLDWFGGTDGSGTARVSDSFTMLISITKNALDAKARDSYLRAAEDALLADSAAVPLVDYATAYEKSGSIHNVASDGLGNWLFHGLSFDR